MSKLQEYLEMALTQKKLDNGVEIDMLGQGDLFTWNQDTDIKKLNAALKAEGGPKKTIHDSANDIEEEDSLGVKILKFIKAAPRRYSEIQRFIGEQVGDHTNNKSMGTHALSRLLPLHCKKVDGKWTLRREIVPSQPYANKYWKEIGFKDWNAYYFASTSAKIEHEKTMGTFDQNEARRDKWRNEARTRHALKMEKEV